MKTYESESPFWHIVVDDAFPRGLIEQAAADWPNPQSEVWLRYDSLLERKRTCNRWEQFPESIRDLFIGMLCFPLSLHDGGRIIPDTMLYGAGMHDMGPGDHLDVHLDADRHALTGMERWANQILFLTDYESCGGRLELWDECLANCMTSIEPRMGRLIAFECSDHSYHGITEPVTGPLRRKSLAVYWWGMPNGEEGQRPRAKFVATESDPYDPVKERLRRERCD